MKQITRGYCIEYISNLVSGWLSHPSEKYEFVSWDDDIPNWMENHPNVPHHQPGKDII